MASVVTFGEIMGRLEPEGFLRLRQSLPGVLKVSFAGAEANVAASIAYMGGEAAFVTALPDNRIADACQSSLRAMGVNTRFIARSAQGRLGLYFVETGANQRPSNVLYDRDNSTISLTTAEAYDWQSIFANAGWFHVTGITPALSAVAADVTLAAVKLAKERKIPVSCDLNFRKKLWRWEKDVPPQKLAEMTMRKILPYVDLLIANEEDTADMLSIRAGQTEAGAGFIDIDRYPQAAREVVKQFPNIGMVAVTLRESLSASHNNWGGMLFEAAKGKAYFAPLVDGKYQPYQIANIVDRIGAGDSFAAALIYAINDPSLRGDLAAVAAFAVAASCLCHSIKGDFNYSSREDIIALMRGKASGRVNR
jgi:2-dehydro-3-deoxygluconokinase